MMLRVRCSCGALLQPNRLELHRCRRLGSTRSRAHNEIPRRCAAIGNVAAISLAGFETEEHIEKARQGIFASVLAKRSHPLLPAPYSANQSLPRIPGRRRLNDPADVSSSLRSSPPSLSNTSKAPTSTTKSVGVEHTLTEGHQHKR